MGWTAGRTRSLLTAPALALVLLGGLATPPATAGTTNPKLPPTERRIVSGWMPYYTADASLASFEANADLFGDVTGFWHSATGTSTITDQLDDTKRAAIVDAVHAKGVKVIAAVTDGTPAHTMSKILGSTTKRTAHVKALVDLAVANHYDGIDLDYEKFAFSDGSSTWATTRPRWVAFVKQLSAALHAKGKWLTVAVPVMYDSDRDGSSGYWVYDYASIGPYVDRMRIMTYDYSVSSPGPIAPISWVRRVLDYATSVVTPGKIQVGVPAYGRDWVTAVTAGCPVDNKPDTSRQTYTSRGALAVAASLGVSPAWSAANGERTFSYTKKYSGVDNKGNPASCTVSRTVWFEEKSAAITRAELVGEYRLAGIAQWTIGGEDPVQWGKIRPYALEISKINSKVELFAGNATYGGAVTVSATVRTINDNPIPNESWKLYWRKGSDGPWELRNSGVTSAAGTLSVVKHPGVSGYWLLKVGGSWARYGATTDPNRTLVRTAVTAGFTASSIKVGASTTLHGRINPTGEVLTVERQRLKGGEWTTVQSTTTRASGTYSLPMTPGAKGTYTYRVKVSGSEVRATGYSPTVTLSVR